MDIVIQTKYKNEMRKQNSFIVVISFLLISFGAYAQNRAQSPQEEKAKVMWLFA